MRRGSFWVLAAVIVVLGTRTVAACGEVAETSDAAVDASPATPCSYSTPFDAPVAVPGVNTPFNEEDATLSPDELTIYFASDRSGPDRPDAKLPGIPLAGVYVAHRGSRGEPFGSATLIPNLDGYQPHPSISSDGLTIVTTIDSYWGPQIGIAKRSSTMEAFGPPDSLVLVGACFGVGDASGRCAHDLWAPFLSADGHQLLAHGRRQGEPNSIHLWQSTDFEEAVQLSKLATDYESYPVLSADGTALYFRRAVNGGAVDRELMLARRATPTSEFEEPVHVALPPSKLKYFDHPTWLSPDACRLYLSGGEGLNAGNGIFVAERRPDPRPADPMPVDFGSLCGSCSDGKALCRGVCVDVTDPYHGCGACSPCVTPHAAPSCAKGACAIGACEANFADCNGNPNDGCETDLTKPSHCRACNAACANGEVCTSTGCAAACPNGQTNCFGTCADTTSSPYHCGSCAGCNSFSDAGIGDSYSFPTCVSSTCGKTCLGGRTNCPTNSGSQCVDLTRDGENCGSCGRHCDSPWFGFGACSAGQCIAACSPGWTLCHGWRCAFFQNDTENCGACDRRCGAGERCEAGACVSTSPVVADNLGAPEDLVVDGATIYFTALGSGGAVRRVPSTGGAVVDIATHQGHPSKLVLDANYVYWTDILGGRVMRARKDGSGAPDVLAQESGVAALRVDDTNLYFTFPGGLGSIPKAQADGGAPTILGTDTMTTAANDLEVENGALYRAAASHLWKIAAPNGPQVDVRDLGWPNPEIISLADGYMYRHTPFSHPSETRWAWLRIADGVVGHLGNTVYPAVALASKGACGVYESHRFQVNPPRSYLLFIPRLAPWPEIQLAERETMAAGRITRSGGYVYWIAGDSILRLKELH